MSIYSRLPGYIQILRPFTLVAPFIAGLIGTITPLKSFGFEELKVAVYVGVTLALLQASGQVINQYADSELDKYVKPYRPIPSGKVSRDDALGIGILLLMLGIGRGFWISTYFGTISLIIAFMAVFYSLSPFSPRRVSAILNSVWLSISRGLLPMVAVYSVYGNLSSMVQYTVIGFLWVLCFQHTKDITDFDYDRMFGIKTIPNTYGIFKSRLFSAIVLLVLSVYISVIGKYIFMVLILLGVLCIMLYTVRFSYTENTVSWSLFYIGVSLTYILTYIDYQFIGKI